ncbi:DUF3883 domain-containing protein [Streptomyces sp. NPDC101112]|uniref:DUF3883 domain-containing protein n=1 Tax=Streptomyces sp. NPDC101112 TaxID=3366105 RepID=UPI00382255EC
MALGEGTRRAARRWLEQLHIADVPRVRALFTHHPDYADLTPVQYAEGLAWLRRAGLVTEGGRPVVSVGAHRQGERAAACCVAQLHWDPASDAARQATGAAGERAVLRLLALGRAVRVKHVALLSDAYGYDIEAHTLDAGSMHIEVKATTDPTRLVIHLTRHEYQVMCRDTDWLLTAVLIGTQGEALSIATVRREWLRAASPEDRDRRGAWESVRFTVPDHALTPGFVRGNGRRLLPEAALPFMPVWGLTSSS